MGLYHGWDDEPDTHADFVRGGVSVEDFEDVRFRGKKKKRRKKAPKTPGCAGNDGGPHVYVWVEGDDPNGLDRLFFKHYGWHKHESKICCGCGRSNGTRFTERYEKVKARKWAKKYGNGEDQPRGEPLPRYGRWRWGQPHYHYWRWELLDPEYRKKYEKLTDTMGFRPYLGRYYDM